MDSAAGLFERLRQCLTEQEKIIERLIRAGEEQLRALKANDLVRLTELAGEQETLAVQLEKAEEERRLIQASLEDVLGMEKGATLSMLLSRAPEPVKAFLAEALAVMRRKLQDLKEVNALNTAVIKKALLVNGRLMQILTGGVPKTYGMKGEIQNKVQYAPVLNKSI